MTKLTLSEELVWRGFINQSTLTDLTELDKKPRTFYHGFDASADSQTVGNLAAMMFDKVFMRHGYKAILLAGGSTSLVGDPGGKDSERPLQDESTIAHNVERAAAQLEQIFSGQDYTLVNNLDWTKDVRLLPFLRDIGKHFSMTPLVQREYIAERMGEGGTGLSYAEFSYTILQGFDYLHLYDNFGCTLQLGGSDQWGNCLSGVELIRRIRGAEVDAVTLKLIIDKSTGKKFGKTEDGAVWLDAAKTSPYKFYQFWLNVDDDSAEDYLKIFTELDKPAIDEIMNKFKNDKSARAAQKVLAHEVTKIVHGEEKAVAVQRTTEVLFANRDYHELEAGDIAELERELPSVNARIGDTILDILSNSPLATSRGDARRLLDQGSVYLNNQAVDHDRAIAPTDLIHGCAVLRKGKNSFCLIKV